MFFDDQLRSAVQRQQQLLMHGDRLRRALASDAQVLRQPLAAADQVRAAWHWLRARPEVIGGAVLVLTVLRPRRAWRLATRLLPRVWAGWQLWQRFERGRARLLGAAGRTPPPGGRRDRR
jgi:hypothetical protein